MVTIPSVIPTQMAKPGDAVVVAGTGPRRPLLRLLTAVQRLRRNRGYKYHRLLHFLAV